MADAQPGRARCWIVSPAFDLFFIVNFWWAAILLLPYARDTGLSQETPVEFWQIYFLTAPHRWITLVLVATDPDRREGRGWVFLVLAVVTALLIVAVRYSQADYRCLVLLDYIWNAWHFGSQHGGILRIYGRMGGGGRPVLERWGFRVFVVYVAMRAAGWATGWTENYAWAQQAMRQLDLAVLAAPALLLIAELMDRPWQRRGKVAYLLSAVTMYTVLLFAIRSGNVYRVIAMSAASAAFHSVEYLAIVTFYAKRRRETGSQAGGFRLMARHWVRILALYMIWFGIISQHTSRSWAELYIALNLWAAFLHYAYDGMIWKLRRSDTARALNVNLASGPVAPSASGSS
jgi:hypothetical protein